MMSGSVRFLMILLLVSCGYARAAQITVTNTANGTTAADGCSLREAIGNANNDAQTHSDWAIGSGTDTIALPAGQTITLSQRLPDIASRITIQGNGATIARDETVSCVTTVPDAGRFGLLRVDGNAVTIDSVTFSGGCESVRPTSGTFTQRGAGAVTKSGASKTRTELVSFLDQDDAYDPEYLAATVDLLRQHPEVDGVRVLPRVAVDMHPLQYESISNSLANTILMRRYAFEFIGGWPDRPRFRELTVGAEDIALRNLFMMVFYEALLHRPLYRFSHRPGNSLDAFLARTEVVDDELVFRAGHEDDRRVQAELETLRLAFARSVRDFIRQNSSAMEPDEHS